MASGYETPSDSSPGSVGPIELGSLDVLPRMATSGSSQRENHSTRSGEARGIAAPQQGRGQDPSGSHGLATVSLSQDLDLTGQISIVEYMPKFTGNYSAVFLGSWKGNLVAVKVIKATGQPDTMKRKLEREIAVWASTSHRNIYPFRGFARDAGFGAFGALISPWCSSGDASRFLAEGGERMMLTGRINLWKGVIEGVIYLHDHDPPIVHGDLKPGNVLIDERGTPRICDFGLARIFFDQGGTGLTTTSEHTGTARYLAPELVASENSVAPTLPSDVYALGCLGLEFIYLQQPYSKHPNNLRGQIFRDIRRGTPPATGPPRQNWPSARLWSVITDCWNTDPGSRSSAFTIGHTLERTIFTLPPSIVQRVIQFLDTGVYNGELWTSLKALAWTERTRCLAQLSLVSQAYWAWATPALYRYIWLRLDAMPRSSYRLIDALKSSKTKERMPNHAVECYGSYTEILVISLGNSIYYPPYLPKAIRTTLSLMPGLRLALITDGLGRGIWPAKLHSLTTLEIRNISISLLLESATIQAMSCFQRLCVCYCAGKKAPVTDGPPSRITLPHLQEIDLYSTPVSMAEDQFLETACAWTMPNLNSLHILLSRYPNSLLDFLRWHGLLLRHLTLRFPAYYQDAVLADILCLCPNLRSFVIRPAPASALLHLPPHLNLETFYIQLAGAGNIHAETYIQQFKAFKISATALFPKLTDWTVAWRDQSLLFSASFHTGDKFIRVNNAGRVYGLSEEGTVKFDFGAG